MSRLDDRDATPWRLWATTYADRAPLVGREVDSYRKPPKGGFAERSADGYWLTVYGPDVVEDGRVVAANPIVEVYTRERRPERPL